MVAVVLSRDELLGAAVVAELSSDDRRVVPLVEVDLDALARHTVAAEDVDVLVVIADHDGGADHAGDPSLVDGARRAMGLLVPAMVASGRGRVILVAPATGLPDRSWEDGSGVVSWGLVGLGRAAAREVAASGVTVNVIRTGLIDRGRDLPAEVVAETPVRRAGTPDDVAAAVGYLASADASYVTGIVLPVDGGLTIGLGAT